MEDLSGLSTNAGSLRMSKATQNPGISTCDWISTGQSLALVGRRYAVKKT
jgi:hypothetical protein